MAFVGIPHEFIDDVVAARVDPVMRVRRFIGGIRRSTVRSFVPTETQQIPRTVNFRATEAITVVMLSCAVFEGEQAEILQDGVGLLRRKTADAAQCR